MGNGVRLMTARLIIGTLGFCIAAIGVFVGNKLTKIMIGEINRARQDGQLMSYVWFTPAKGLLISREYQRLYPEGKLLIYSYVAFAVVIAGMLTVAVCANHSLISQLFTVCILTSSSTTAFTRSLGNLDPRGTSAFASLSTPLPW